MTGFGSADGAVADGRVRVEIRTVNHRYFNPQFKLPSELAGVEGQLRDRLRQLLDRGHVAVSVRWLEPPSSESAVTVDLTRARQVVAAAKELKKRLRLKGEVDLAFVARQPDVITLQGDGGSGGSAGSAAAAWSDLERIVERAAQEVLAMRAREGRALAAELAQRLGALESGARAVEERAPARLVAEHERLQKAVSEPPAGGPVGAQRPGVAVDPDEVRVATTEDV